MHFSKEKYLLPSQSWLTLKTLRVFNFLLVSKQLEKPKKNHREGKSSEGKDGGH